MSEFKQAAVAVTLAILVLAFVVFGIWYTTQPSAEMTRIEDKLDRIITLLEGQNGKPTPAP